MTLTDLPEHPVSTSPAEPQTDSPIDRREKLHEAPFDFRVTKNSRVLITWHGKQVKTLSGNAAQKLINALPALDDHGVQLALAKATGNFKRGNERKK
jgi:hypothetical protein